MAENQLQKLPPGELDIFEMFDRMGVYFKQLCRWLFNLAISITQWAIKIIVFSIRNIAWFIIFGLLGYGLLMAWENMPSHNAITTELIARSNALHESDVIEYINRTGVLLKSRSEADLATAAVQLNIPLTDVQQIISLQAGWGVDTDNDGAPNRGNYTEQRDTTGVVEGLFYVKLRTKNKDIIGQMEHNLLDFLQGNNYFNQQHSAHMHSLMAQKASIDKEVEALVQLQQGIYAIAPQLLMRAASAPSTTEAVGTVANNIQIPLYHHDILSLESQSRRIASELTNASSIITIVQPFTNASRQPTESKLKCSIGFGLLGLVLAFLWKQRRIVSNTLGGGDQLNLMLEQSKRLD